MTAPKLSTPVPTLVRPRAAPPPPALSVSAPEKVNELLSPPTVSVLGVVSEELVKKPVPEIWCVVWLKPARSKPEAVPAIRKLSAGRLSLPAQRMTPPETRTEAPFRSAEVEGVPRTRTPLPVFVRAMLRSVRSVDRPPLRVAVTP